MRHLRNILPDRGLFFIAHFLTVQMYLPRVELVWREVNLDLCSRNSLKLFLFGQKLRLSAKIIE